MTALVLFFCTVHVCVAELVTLTVVKNRKTFINLSFCLSFLLRNKGCNSFLVFLLVPTEGTLTPNKILLHLFRKYFKRECTRQARDDEIRLDSHLKPEQKTEIL